MLSKSQRRIIALFAIAFTFLTLVNVVSLDEAHRYYQAADVKLTEADQLYADANSIAAGNAAIQEGYLFQPSLLRWVDKDDVETLFYCDNISYKHSYDDKSSPAWWITHGNDNYRHMPNYDEVGETIFYHPYHDKNDELHVETYQLRIIRACLYSIELRYDPIPSEYNTPEAVDEFLLDHPIKLNIDRIDIPATSSIDREIAVNVSDETVIIDEKTCTCVVCGCGDSCKCK